MKLKPRSNSCCSESDLARQPQLQHRHARGVVADDQRRVGARWQLPQLSLDDRRDLRHGHLHFGRRLEEHFHQADPVQRLGLDVLDVVHCRRQRALDVVDDARGHLFGGQAAVVPHHRDHRDVDAGQDVHRRAKNGERSQDQQDERQHDEGVRPAERDADDPHALSLCRDPSGARTLTIGLSRNTPQDLRGQRGHADEWRDDAGASGQVDRAVLHDESHPAQRGDVRCRIAVHCDEICRQSWRDTPDAVVDVQDTGGH